VRGAAGPSVGPPGALAIHGKGRKAPLGPPQSAAGPALPAFSGLNAPPLACPPAPRSRREATVTVHTVEEDADDEDAVPPQPSVTRNKPISLLHPFRDRLTARGLSGGSRKVITTREPCALFLGTRVDMLWTALGLGFQPTHIHLRHGSLGPLVRLLAPGASIVSSCTPEWQATLPAVSFVQGFAHTFRFLFEKSEAVLCTNVRKRQMARPPPGWHLTHTSASHASVGGVTDGHDFCFGWLQAVNAVATTTRIPVPGALPRDVHSVVSDTVAGRPSRAPQSMQLDTPVVHPYKPGLFNAGGLYPLDVTRPWFRVRSVYSPSMYCDRTLTSVERASVFDVPLAVVNALSQEDLERVLVQPGRTFERCAHAVLAHAGILDRGGGFVFSLALRGELRDQLKQDPTPELQAQWIGEAGKQRDFLGKKTADPSTVTDNEKGATALPFPPKADVNPQKAAERATNVTDPPAKTSVESAGPTKGGQASRDLKATKSDDAAVPVWLWNDAIRAGLEHDPQERGYMDGDIDHALEVLRKFLLLRKFKLGVTRSYFSYVKEEYPEIGCRPDRAAVEWKEERYWTGRQWKEGRYVWKSRGSNLVGRKLYQGWWSSFWGNAKAEKFAGHDAIWRSSESTWWDWDSGSAPLYWRWPKEYRVVIRDGLPIWFSGEKPRWRRPQQAERDEGTRQRVIKKLDKVRKGSIFPRAQSGP
jgi:hypothetical protein